MSDQSGAEQAAPARGRARLVIGAALTTFVDAGLHLTGLWKRRA